MTEKQIMEWVERECDKDNKDYSRYDGSFCEQSYIDGAQLLAPMMAEMCDALEKISCVQPVEDGCSDCCVAANTLAKFDAMVWDRDWETSI